jgi:hypothetical protein
MLPGFRFLFAAIILSMSLLVFGLGAAALLRVAHEEFASNPSWRAPPEMTFAQRPDATRPVLAALRVDLAPKALDEGPAIAAPAEQAAIAPQPSAAEEIAALKAEPSSPEVIKAEAANMETAKPEVIPVAESRPANDAAPVQPEKTEELNIAAIAPGIAPSEVSPPDDRQADASAEPTGAEAVVSPADSAATRIATLGGPPVEIETAPPAKSSAAKPDQARPDESAIKRRQRARRAAHRRRLAARARLAAQIQQMQANPFFQPPTPTIPPLPHAR